MEKSNPAVSDSGPLIHLAQINAFNVLSVFNKIYIPEEVFNEVCLPDLAGSIEVKKSKQIELRRLEPKTKDLAKIISEKFSLGLGEAEALSLAKQEKISLFLTDDLESRIVAKELGLKPHGSAGIVLRAFKKGIIKENEAVEIIKKLHSKSTLFITSYLVNYILKEIARHGKK